MNTPARRSAMLADVRSQKVQFPDRFAQPDRRPQRTKPLMRKIEAASLLPDQSIHFSSHAVPRAEIFERVVGGFARGALLSTPYGPTAIEDLLPGDIVESSEGPQPILWIGSTILFADPIGEAQTLLPGLVRIMGDSFGLARPQSDVLLGPVAAMLHNPPQLKQSNGMGHVLTPVQDFIDGLNVFHVTPPSPVKIYHIVLERHAAVRVSGLEVETYHPGPGAIEALGENGRRLFLSLFPHINVSRDFGPMAFPRIGRDVLDGLNEAS